ncbi:caspase family protein [Leptospira santarosai]|uniref:caspase family protein n=1 Tax=Leptospira santarosai TaxID=28183 RepID=UPI0024AF02BE|nr:caspase family protein [Leptospira santarosai]MDI7230084.1 caspase family protein [Leptospira santarosai]
MQDRRFLYTGKHSNSKALVIGINTYKEVSSLSYAKNDALAFKDVLIQEFNFLAENVTLLLDEDATKNSIMNSFFSFVGSSSELDDRIIFFFAGHGSTQMGSRGEVGFLVPYDAKLADLATFIRWDDFTRNAEFIRAKHILFILDACFSGLALTRNSNFGKARFLKDMMHRYSRQVLTAGKANETVSDSGGPIPNHSVFTGHLLEGLQGKAADEDGILTANSLMAYVHSKVSSDRNSAQTPHFGYSDGDGDLIFSTKKIELIDSSNLISIDRMYITPNSEDEFTPKNLLEKISNLKNFLSSDSYQIDLHDLLMNEIQNFTESTKEDNFKLQGVFSNDEFLDRLAKYENTSLDLAVLLGYTAYWAKQNHYRIIQKTIARTTDRFGLENGLVVWLNLRWYPLIIILYIVGVVSVEGNRYDSLYNLFFTRIDPSLDSFGETFIFEKITDVISELTRNKIFNKIPGHENQYTPMSEYLFKLIQPKIENILFVGRNFERAFTEFEILFALTVAHSRIQKGKSGWGPIGRFGWQHLHSGNHSPLRILIEDARQKKQEWEPIKVGFFNGKFEQFDETANEFLKIADSLPWH